MQIRVETYSGYQADERPIRFFAGTTEYKVQEVMDHWYGPDDTWFRVRAQDGFEYVLRHRTGANVEDVWTLEAFRR